MSGATEAPTVAAAAALDRLKGICDPRAGCPRWPEHLRLYAEATGELIEGRCKATNRCKYCQARYVAETVEALLLDGLYGPSPSIYVVLTAREHLTRADTHAHLRQLRRSLRKQWDSIEWFVQVEFQLRGALHLNLLTKGVEQAEREELHQRMTELWCARVDAQPVGQWSGDIVEEGGLAKYLGKRLGHGLKAEQAPPLGWKGHRTSQTRGYFNRPVTELREEARRVFRRRALMRRAIAAGNSPHDAELLVVELEQLADQTSWRILSLNLRRRWEGVNDESEAQHPTEDPHPGADSTGAGARLGRVLDSPAASRMGNPPDGDVTPEARRERRDRGRSPGRRTPRPPADSRRNGGSPTSTAPRAGP